MNEKYTILDWILGIIIMSIVSFTLIKIEKLSGYFVSLINPISNQNLYRDIITGIILVITGLIFMGLSVKLNVNSFLQKVSEVLCMLNGFVFLFYLLYIVIRILGFL